MKQAVIDHDTKLMLTFLTRKYLDVYSFVECCSEAFPGVLYSDTSDIPIFVRFSDDRSISDIFDRNDKTNAPLYSSHPDEDTSSKRELINANHNMTVGKKLKSAFIYDRKVIADNRSLFRRIEKFEKAETIFGYSCIARSMIYSNCVKWELSAYENSNMCGCQGALYRHAGAGAGARQGYYGVWI